MKQKLQLLKGIRSLTINSQPNIYLQPKQEGTKANGQYHQFLNKHTKATLNSLIPKTTHYIDEVMLHRLGLKAEIWV